MLQNAYKEDGQDPGFRVVWALKEWSDVPGRPAAFMKDWRRSIEEITNLTEVSWSSCRRIFAEELWLRWIVAKLVLHLLTAEQKLARVDACQELKQQLEIDPDMFFKVIKGRDVVLLSRVRPGNKAAVDSVEPGVPASKKSSAGQIFDAGGIVHREFVPQGTTVNQKYYLDVLRRLQEVMRRKRPMLWESGDWWLHDENA